MSLITDGILIAASLTACFYCLVLNVRLKALRNTDSGIGATISQLSASVSELQNSLSETQAASKIGAEKLEDLVGEAGTLADFLSELLEQAETAREGLTAGPAPQEGVAGEAEEPLTGIPLDLDYDDTQEAGAPDAAAPDLNIELDYEDGPSDEPASEKDESNEDTVPIDLEDQDEEPLKTGTG